MRSKVNKLVIIGNGFDLHHGIKSKYIDFYRSDYISCEIKALYDNMCNWQTKIDQLWRIKIGHFRKTSVKLKGKQFCAGGKKVTKLKMYEKIQNLKNKVYGKRRAAREADVSRGTVDKYWDMNEEEYIQYLIDSKTQTKILDPYRGFIETQIKTYREITESVIHDHLREEYPDLNVSARTVRKYVAVLREELGLPAAVKVRQYAEVAELPPGLQAQVDMGGKVMPVYLY